MTFRTLRRKAGHTQQSLAAKARKGRGCLSQKVISKIERGETRDPQWSTISALALALGTTPDAIIAAIRATPRLPKVAP
jgi:transcriptional regulator with XRE-family HTH domain